MSPFTIHAISLLSLLSLTPFLVVAAPEAAITASPRLPTRHSPRDDASFLQALAWKEQAMAARALKPGMNVCYGTNSICSLYMDIECSLALEGDLWYKCMCESGRVAANAACQNCQDVYDLGGTFDFEEWKDTCSSKKFKLGPIPKSIMSAWSQGNATMTADATKTGSGSGSAEATDSIASATGSPWTITMYGDPTGERPTPLSTTTGLPPLAASDGTGGASGWNSGAVMFWSVGAAGFSVLCGIMLIL